MRITNQRCALMLVELVGTLMDHTLAVGAGPLRLAGHSGSDCSPEQK